MTGHQDTQGSVSRGGSPLTAHECRLLTDRFLDHVGADPVWNDSLNYLAQRLFALAVQAERLPGWAESPSS
ncbi:hypothetical protein HNQ08_004741 [Deinococcus humi]|uniref:Uncharacterized protein n=1 Tax=Deinococcus humi TaxID=662880 RepID=A0A7W8JYM5_9DEIO|nr:hypothetical protein [Deinococcus humi]GGO36801.1 hypothetical protein GCM10008949_41190 [Deinococcus humi]